MNRGAETAPPYGHAALREFLLAPDLVHLNHGSFGALPRSVLAEQDRLRAHIERDPTTFFTFEFPQAIRDMAKMAAAHFGGTEQDWVFCENATAAANAVLASVPLKPGDEIVTTTHAYGAVAKAMRIWAARREAKLVLSQIPAFVTSEDDILEPIAAALTSKTRLLVADHITSATAIVLPVKRIVEIAKAKKIPVLIDGAHAPGQIPLDVPAIGADWYTGNAHKWLFAPKGCALLWTAPAQQSLTRPVSLSHGSPDGYTQAFDWVGTLDVTPWLCLKAALKAHDAFGGAKLMARNRTLAAQAALHLQSGLAGQVSAPAAMRAAMASLALPANPEPGLDRRLRLRLVKEHGIVAPLSLFADRLWVRISAQIYNEADDYARLGVALRKSLVASS